VVIYAAERLPFLAGLDGLRPTALVFGIFGENYKVRKSEYLGPIFGTMDETYQRQDRLPDANPCG